MASSFATMLPSGIMTIEGKKLGEFVQRTWDAAIVPALTEYVRIPAKSPMFDREWAEHGHLDRAVGLIETWARSRPIEGLRVEVVRLDGRTPVLLLEAPGAGGETVLLYGHCDKQPEMVGWAPESGPWTPVRRGDKLYGRGVGDDGYAAFAALTAMEALQAQRVEHARCVVLIEACEESGSYDLPFYVDALAERLGAPSLVVCLDSGCGNYEQLWGTTSLRGVVGGVLTVEVLTEGVHSGAASGIVPSSFRILRQLLDRVEDSRTGQILPRDFHVHIPRARVTLDTYGDAGNGWNAPAPNPELLESINRASLSYFGKPAMFAGLGGSIPFMSMLGERFPQAQFLITGAMGPGSNAHGPNEFLHLPTGARVTACVAEVVGDHSDRSRR